MVNKGNIDYRELYDTDKLKKAGKNPSPFHKNGLFILEDRINLKERYHGFLVVLRDAMHGNIKIRERIVRSHDLALALRKNDRDYGEDFYPMPLFSSESQEQAYLEMTRRFLSGNATRFMVYFPGNIMPFLFDLYEKTPIANASRLGISSSRYFSTDSTKIEECASERDMKRISQTAKKFYYSQRL